MDSTHQKPGLTVFFPCYNDQGTIQNLVGQADAVAREWTNDYEILVIDDGSSDGSQKILKDLERQNPSLHVIFHEHNQGYGAALQTGFANASKDLIFIRTATANTTFLN